MKVKKTVSIVINVLLFSLFISIMLLVISSRLSGGEPNVLGYQLKTVLSGSMEPSIKTGSIISVKPGGDMTRFKKGDVITFMKDQATIVTHRVLEVKKDNGQVLYITKGDNNEDPDSDPVWSGKVVAEYIGFTIPYIGYVANFAKSKEGSMVLLLIPAIFLLIYAFNSIKVAFAEIKKQKKAKEATNSTINNNINV